MALAIYIRGGLLSKTSIGNICFLGFIHICTKYIEHIFLCKFWGENICSSSSMLIISDSFIAICIITCFLISPKIKEEKKASEMHVATQIFSSTFNHYQPLSTTFIYFCPLSTTINQFQPLPFTYIHFCPLSSTFIHIRPF